jgi:hypothetical protein
MSALQWARQATHHCVGAADPHSFLNFPAIGLHALFAPHFTAILLVATKWRPFSGHVRRRRFFRWLRDGGYLKSSTLCTRAPQGALFFSPPAALLLCSHPRYIGGKLWRVLAFMRKRDELFRNVPANIHELRLALAGLPQDMKVLADSETGVSENSVEALCARTTWPSDLVVTTPRKLHPKSVVKISKA